MSPAQTISAFALKERPLPALKRLADQPTDVVVLKGAGLVANLRKSAPCKATCDLACFHCTVGLDTKVVGYAEGLDSRS